MEKLSNPQVTIETIKKYDFAFQKKFGQNFLIDGRVLDKIIAAANVDPEDFMDPMDDLDVEVEDPIPQFRPRKRPVKSIYRPKWVPHTPAHLGGHPRNAYVPYRNYNRHTGNRHK